MIFNTWDYYLLFLLPSAMLFRVLNTRYRPWVVLGSGSLFFLYFSYTQLGGLIGVVSAIWAKVELLRRKLGQIGMPMEQVNRFWKGRRLHAVGVE